MIKYDNYIGVRINDKLKNAIVEICNDAQINEADWIRSRLADCVKKDALNLDQVKEDFMFG